MRIADADPSDVRAFWDELDGRLAGREVLEDAAQVFAEGFSAHFSESVVLARVFVTLPYGKLPEEHRRFVEGLAGDADGALAEGTPVLTLIGTSGVEPDWNDRRRSRGHRGVPLLSASFVREIPMIATLLGELGLPMNWHYDADREIVQRVLGRSTGLFYVEDAARSLDAAGRRIIPARDFVEAYGVGSVFGIGGAYFGGMIVVAIVFCRECVPRAAALRLAGLVNFFKSRTTPLACPERVFAGGAPRIAA